MGLAKFVSRDRWEAVDNKYTSTKVDIRRRVLEVLTPEAAHVFDAFAGTGIMYGYVWRHAARYVGCDERWHRDARSCYVADNRRVLRCLDLAAFNCFDLDAYGSPWEQVAIVVARRPPLAVGERLGLVLTDGSWSAYRTGKIPPGLQGLSGVPTVRSLGRTTAQMSRNAQKQTAKTRVDRFDDLLTRGLLGVARRVNGRLIREWRAASPTGAYARYLGVVIEGGRTGDEPKAHARAGARLGSEGQNKLRR